MKTVSCLLIALCLAGCETAQPLLPEGVDGYQCYRRASTGAGFVFAEAYPDYQGGMASLTLSWKAQTAGTDSWEAQAVWTSGPKAISPPGWITVNRFVPVLPPLHSRIRLQLSSGETVEQEFVNEKLWREWKQVPAGGGFGGLVDIHEPRLMEAFTKARWADVGVFDPAGAMIATSRIDLSELPAALVTMRSLGDQVTTDVTDYQHRCGEIHIEVN